MTTIEQILQENWCSILEYKKCIKSWVCNWIWWKGWINFDKLINKLPYFDTTKWKKLHQDLDYLSMCHDLSYNKGWNLFNFLKANYILWKNVIKLIHWTNLFWKVLVFLCIFLWTTLFGFKYYNWK